jgi:hypothetical protein
MPGRLPIQASRRPYHGTVVTQGLKTHSDVPPHSPPGQRSGGASRRRHRVRELLHVGTHRVNRLRRRVPDPPPDLEAAFVPSSVHVTRMLSGVCGAPDTLPGAADFNDRGLGRAFFGGLQRHGIRLDSFKTRTKMPIFRRGARSSAAVAAPFRHPHSRAPWASNVIPANPTGRRVCCRAGGCPAKLDRETVWNTARGSISNGRRRHR